jgi:addiction module HigA family antidote
MARTPIHPGEHLAEELKELGISAAELARQIDVPVNRVTGIINGQRAITADTALRLGHWFGTSSEFWLNLQKLYELRLAREEVGDRVEKLPKLTERKRSKARRAASQRALFLRTQTNKANSRNFLKSETSRGGDSRVATDERVVFVNQDRVSDPEPPHVFRKQRNLVFRVLLGVPRIRFNRVNGHPLDRDTRNLFLQRTRIGVGHSCCRRIFSNHYCHDGILPTCRPRGRVSTWPSSTREGASTAAGLQTSSLNTGAGTLKCCGWSSRS